MQDDCLHVHLPNQHSSNRKYLVVKAFCVEEHGQVDVANNRHPLEAVNIGARKIDQFIRCSLQELVNPLHDVGTAQGSGVDCIDDRGHTNAQKALVKRLKDRNWTFNANVKVWVVDGEGHL